MRVVALAPSVTNIVESLGQKSSLVATTDHENRYPSVGGWLTPDLDEVASYNPDVVITTDALQEDIVAQLERNHNVIHCEPTTIDGVAQSIRTIGNTLSDGDLGEAGAAQFRTRLHRQAHEPVGKRPTVYCEEWMTPPMAAGNWVPEIVELVGGVYPFNDGGNRSAPITADAFEEAKPDIAVLHICGRGTDVSPAFDDRGWDAPAIREENVHVVHDDLLNQPSFNLIEGAARLRSLVQQWAKEP